MNVGVVGNGAFGALVDRRARIVWCCLNGFSSDPVFNSLLNNDSEEGGWFDVQIENLAKTEQKYIPNTAILITTLISSTNDVLQIKDFAPRFLQHDRSFQPFQLFRILTRIRGDPKATIRIRPSFEYNAAEGYQTRGSHHVRYCGPTGTLRLTTNASIQLVIEESAFLVHEPIFLVFGPDESFANSIPLVAKEYEERTLKFWKRWTGTLCLPVDYQDILARACISLQLLHSEELGSFVAAMTMGVTDGRVFELVDLCMSVPVLRDFGMFFEIRRFLEFLKSIVFQPEYPLAIYPTAQQEQFADMSSLAGFRGQPGVPAMARPDFAMFGLITVALSHGFLDVRLKDVCSVKLFEKLELWAEEALATMLHPVLTGYCSALALMGDGTEPGVSTMGSVLAWAAADRLGRVAAHSHWAEKAKYWQARAGTVRAEILQHAVNTSGDKAFLASRWGGAGSCTALLRAAELGFISATETVWAHTVARTEAVDATASLLWFAEGLRSSGQETTSRTLFHAICASSTECGLFPESIDLQTATLSGNLPHLGTLLGILRLGSRLSRKWTHV